MKILGIHFGGNGKVEPAKTPVEVAVCQHGLLVPHWDSAADMGKRETVAYYTCDACQKTFPRAEGQEMRVAAAELAEATRRR